MRQIRSQNCYWYLCRLRGFNSVKLKAILCAGLCRIFKATAKKRNINSVSDPHLTSRAVSRQLFTENFRFHLCIKFWGGRKSQFSGDKIHSHGYVRRVTPEIQLKKSVVWKASFFFALLFACNEPPTDLFHRIRFASFERQAVSTCGFVETCFRDGFKKQGYAGSPVYVVKSTPFEIWISTNGTERWPCTTFPMFPGRDSYQFHVDAFKLFSCNLQQQEIR